MKPVWVAFFVGMIVGGNLGVILMGMLFFGRNHG